MNLPAHLAALVSAAHSTCGGELAPHVAALIDGAKVTAEHRALVDSMLEDSGRPKADTLILAGADLRDGIRNIATLRVLASALAQLCDSQLGVISEGPNAAGAALAGVLPHRDAGAQPGATEGLDASAMLNAPRRAYLIMNFEPEADTADGTTATRALQSADHVIALTSFASDHLRECAEVLLPTGTFAETPGTFVNAAGTWQSFEAAMPPVGQARPAWRVLRVLGNLLELDGFDYETCAQVRQESTGNRRRCCPG